MDASVEAMLVKLFEGAGHKTMCALITNPDYFWTILDHIKAQSDQEQLEHLRLLSESINQNCMNWIFLQNLSRGNRQKQSIFQFLVQWLLDSQHAQIAQLLLEGFLFPFIDQSTIIKHSFAKVLKAIHANNHLQPDNLRYLTTLYKKTITNLIAKRDSPRSYFYFINSPNGLVLDKPIPISHFREGFTYCTHVLVIDFPSKMTLLHLESDDSTVLELSLSNKTLYLQVKEWSLQCRELIPNSWVYIKVDVFKNFKDQFLINIQFDKGQVVEFPVHYHLPADDKVRLSLCNHFIGKMSYALLFSKPQHESTTFNYKKLLQTDDLNQVQDLLHHALDDTLFFYSPILLNGLTCYDLLAKNNSTIDANVGQVIKSDPYDYYQFQTLSGLLYFISTNFDQQLFSDLFDILLLIFKNFENSQEMGYDMRILILLKMALFRINDKLDFNDLIQKLQQLNQIITYPPLKEQVEFFTELLQCMTKFDFKNQEDCRNLFNLLQHQYDKKFLNLIQLFGIGDILKLMFEECQLQQIECCADHFPDMKDIRPQDKQRVLLKATYFSKLLNYTYQRFASILSKNPSNELYLELFKRSVHQTLSFCTNYYLPCYVAGLLAIIFEQVKNSTPQLVDFFFPKFESTAFIIILFSKTTYPDIKAYCIKLLHVISTQASNIQVGELVQCLKKSIEQDAEAKVDHVSVLAAIIDWTLSLPITFKLQDSLIYDECCQIKFPQMLRVLFSVLKQTSDVMKINLLAVLLNLLKANDVNKDIIAGNWHYLKSIIKLLLLYQSKELQDPQSLQHTIFDNLLRVFALLADFLIYSKENYKCLLDIAVCIKSIDSTDVARHLLRNVYKQLLTLLYCEKSDFKLSEAAHQTQFQFFINEFFKVIINDQVLVTQQNQDFFILEHYKESQYLFLNDQMQGSEDYWHDYSLRKPLEKLLQMLCTKQEAESQKKVKRKVKFFVKPFLGEAENNIYLMRIMLQLFSLITHYGLTSPFMVEVEFDSAGILHSLRGILEWVIMKGQDLKSENCLKNEKQILDSHFLFVQTHASLLEHLELARNNFSNEENIYQELQIKQSLQEKKNLVMANLVEYYAAISKGHLVYLDRMELVQQNVVDKSILWSICYELLRLSYDIGIVDESFLENHKEVAKLVANEEIISYFTSSPYAVQKKQRTTMLDNHYVKSPLKKTENNDVHQWIFQLLNKYFQLQQENEILWKQEMENIQTIHKLYVRILRQHLISIRSSNIP